MKKELKVIDYDLSIKDFFKSVNAFLKKEQKRRKIKKNMKILLKI